MPLPRLTTGLRQSLSVSVVLGLGNFVYSKLEDPACPRTHFGMLTSDNVLDNTV